MMACRDEVLACAQQIVHRKRKNEFTIPEILDCMRERGSQYGESTIRTHVTSRMCTNAPQHHGVKYHDFRRIGHGLYQLQQ